MKFSFPILTKTELLQCLEDFGIRLTEQNYKSPQKDQMFDIYNVFVEKLMGIKARDFSLFEFSSSEIFEFPSLHEDSVPRLTLDKALFHLMKVCGVSDFSIRDITNPDFQRTRRNLSALINFTKFRESQLKKFQELQAETEKNENLVKDKKDTLMKFRESIKEQHKKKNGEEEEAHHIELEMKKFSVEINELNIQQANLQREIQNKKEFLLENTDQLTNLKSQILETKALINELQTKIVKSPKRIKQEILELNRTISLEKNEISEIEKYGRELLVKHDSLNNLQMDVKKMMGLVEEVDTCINEYDGYSNEIDRIRDKIEEMQQQLKSLNTAEQQNKRVLNRHNEKCIQAQAQHDQRILHLQDLRRKLKEEHLNLEKTLEIKENLFLSQHSTCQETLDHKKNKLQQLKDEYHQTCLKINSYLDTIHSAMKNESERVQ